LEMKVEVNFGRPNHQTTYRTVTRKACSFIVVLKRGRRRPCI
jgi:hypothetical protein